MTSVQLNTLLKLAAFALLMLPQGALAYVGPGAGFTAIGTVLALLLALLLTVVGFVWYPVKRFVRSRRRAQEEGVQKASGPSDSEETGSSPLA